MIYKSTKQDKTWVKRFEIKYRIIEEQIVQNKYKKKKRSGNG